MAEIFGFNENHIYTKHRLDIIKNPNTDKHENICNFLFDIHTCLLRQKAKHISLLSPLIFYNVNEIFNSFHIPKAECILT